MLGCEQVERPSGLGGVERRFPWVGRDVVCVGHEAKASLLPLLPPPVVDELVARYADDPWHVDGRRVVTAGGVDCSEKRLRSEIFRQRRPATPGDEIGVDVGEGVVIEGQEGGRAFPGRPTARSRPYCRLGGRFSDSRRGAFVPRRQRPVGQFTRCSRRSNTVVSCRRHSPGMRRGATRSQAPARSSRRAARPSTANARD